MALSGILIPGTRKLTYFSLTNRTEFLPSCSHYLTHKASVGVGFSYADYGETVETTEKAAKNVHAFISIFFETFKGFSGRPLHLSGESYGVNHPTPFSSIHTNIVASRGGTYPSSRVKYMIKIKLSLNKEEHH